MSALRLPYPWFQKVDSCTPRGLAGLWRSLANRNGRRRTANGSQLIRVKLLEFSRIEDRRGNLTFIEGGRQAPFDIKRVYYLYDVPGGAARAGHAHKALQQILVAMSGSFDVTVDDGAIAGRSISPGRTTVCTFRR